MRWMNGLLVSVFVVLAVMGTAAQSGTFDCPGTLAPRLEIGGLGRVTPGAANNVRSMPTTSGPLQFQLQAGMVFEVLDGPVCADGFVWWQVRERDSLGTGWTVEGTGDSYFLEPVEAADLPTESTFVTITPRPTVTTQPGEQTCAMEPRLEIRGTARLTTNTPSRLRDAPSTAGSQIGTLQPLDEFTVIEGPVCADGIQWWQVSNDGLSGWTAEGVDGNYLLELVEGAPTPTVVASNTPAPTATPQLADQACPMEPRMETMREGRLTSNTPSRLRDQPSTSAAQIGMIQPQDVFMVLGGPTCQDGIVWWRVRAGNLTGWTAEGVDGTYLIELVPLVPTATPPFIALPTAYDVDWVGDLIVVGTENGAFVFDATDFDTPPSQFLADLRIENLAINPLDPTQIVLSVDDGEVTAIILYDLASGEQVMTIDPAAPIGIINSMTFLEDGRLAYNRFGFLTVFDLELGEVVYVVNGPGRGTLGQVAISADGERISGFYMSSSSAEGVTVAVGEYGMSAAELTLIDSIDNEPIPPRLTDMAFAPDSSRFIIGDSLGSLRQWTVPDLEYNSFIRGERSTTSNRINAVIYHPTEPLVITAESDPQAVVRAFNVQSLSPVNAYTAGVNTSAAVDLDFNDDASQLAVLIDDTVHILEDYALVAQLVLQRN